MDELAPTRDSDALRVDEERLRLEMFQFATDQAADCVYWLDRDARFFYVNDQACRSLGYTRDELLQFTLFDIDPHTPRHLWSERWAQDPPPPGEWLQIESLNRRKDGTTFPVEVRARHVWFGNMELRVAFVRDISDRKKAEQALRDSEYFLARSQAIARLGSYNFDIAAGTWVCTPMLDEIFGIDASYPHDAAGWLGLIVPEQREEMQTYLLQHVVAEGHRFERDYRIQRPADGKVRWMFGNGELEFNEAGLATRMFGTISDITEQKDAEARLLHAQKLESLGVLAGGIAHDFNNLLMAIIGNLDLAVSHLSPLSAARACIDQSMTAARRASDLTRQMLAYSGKVSFDVREMDLSELVIENAELFRSSVTRLVTLNLEPGRDIPRIKADVGQVQQVIMNLITNAAEAIGEHGGLIRLSTGTMDCTEADLKNSRAEAIPEPGRFVFLEVADTGCGMDEHTQQRLFDPFFTTKFTGRGLGMAAILGIVRGHTGAILVSSRPGEGTTIRVLFPVSSDPLPVVAGDVRTRPAQEVSLGRAGRILVVDDEGAVRSVARRMLERDGWRVVESSNGPEALEVFAREAGELDCVLLDLSMPGMDGLAVYRHMQAIRADSTVILMSGFANDHVGGGMGPARPAGFLQKPFSSQDLRHELTRVLAPVAKSMPT